MMGVREMEVCQGGGADVQVVRMPSRICECHHDSY